MSKTSNTKKPLDRIQVLERLRRKILSPSSGLKGISSKAEDHHAQRQPISGRSGSEPTPKEGKGGPGPAGQGDFSPRPDHKKLFRLFRKK